MSNLFLRHHSMKAVILAAGKGTRMGSLTADTPKPMLAVKGKAILEHIIEGVKDAGVVRLCVVTGWRAEAIETHFRDGSRWGVSIQYVRQTVQDGTGKAPELAKDFVGEDPFLLTYGDILVKPDAYRRLREAYERTDRQGAISVIKGENVTKGGVNLFDSDFCLEEVVEKPSPETLKALETSGRLKPGSPVWYNAGLYIFEPSLFTEIARLEKSPRDEYELTDAINGLCRSGAKLAGSIIEGDWADVRDPQTLRSLSPGRERESDDD